MNEKQQLVALLDKFGFKYSFNHGSWPAPENEPINNVWLENDNNLGKLISYGNLLFHFDENDKFVCIIDTAD